MTKISFPRQYARTRRFSLGTPRAFVISPDGQRVLFLRSKSGSDPLTCLYELDLATGSERLVVDPELYLTGSVEQTAPEEQARRERVRESASGLVRFHTDALAQLAVFDLSGHLYLVDVASGAVEELGACRPAIEARLSPSGEHVAYCSGGSLRLISAAGVGDRAVAVPEATEGDAAIAGQVSYGMPEFVAAEEMDRSEGYWWAPDSLAILVARVDTTRVSRRYIADLVEPTRPPVEQAYPAAGEMNADVTLHIVSVATSREMVGVDWDREAFEYLTAVSWSGHGLVIAVQSRDQRSMRLLDVDPATGAVSVVREDRDDLWLDIVPGVPARVAGGAVVWTADVGDSKRLVVGNEVVTPDGLQVRRVLGTDGDSVMLAASVEPTEIGVWRWSPAEGLAEILGEAGPSVTTGCCGGGTTVLVRGRLDRPDVAVSVHRPGQSPVDIKSLAETPVITPRPCMRRYGETEIRTAVLFPDGYEPGSERLPVLLDPYGGPHAQMVTATSRAYLTSQWFADQGYCVVVADGRGTPGRGAAWDRAIHGRMAAAVLEDQITALRSVAQELDCLDLSRVAIRGWSFGGYLAALAVLRRPDVFHAAVSGAPVTDWRLYDTHYTERYLGDPYLSSQTYDENSLIGDAGSLKRPLLIIHGLADDNVAAANTLRLSSALLAAGRQHFVLPLSGVTHMTPQEVVAENLLLFQVEFLRTALAAPAELAR